MKYIALLLPNRYFLSFVTYILTIITSSESVFAQAEVKYYEIINDIVIKEFDFRKNEEVLGNKPIVVKGLRYFTLIAEDSGKAVIRFINWDSNLKELNQRSAKLEFLSDSVWITGAKYYVMKSAYLNNNCVRIHQEGRHSIKFAVGFVTMPLKLRLGQNFEFEPTFSLGGTAGLKMRISKHQPNFINVLFGASTSTVNLDSFSTKGRVSETIKNIFVFSSSFGLVAEFSKSQVGIFYGRDYMGKSNNSKYDWIYHRKPWFTIGFGFTIFSIEDKSTPSQPADTP